MIIKLKIIKTLNKGKNQKNKDQDEKQIHYKLGLKCEIKNNKTFIKGSMKKIKIKRIRIKLKTSINDKKRSM